MSILIIWYPFSDFLWFNTVLSPNLGNEADLENGGQKLKLTKTPGDGSAKQRSNLCLGTKEIQFLIKDVDLYSNT